MKSGGFSPSERVSNIKVPSLILWGREDGILDGKEFAPKFLTQIEDSELRWVEECGHVPHLEQADVTAELIAEFLTSNKFDDVDVASGKSADTGADVTYPVGLVFGATALAGAAAALAGGVGIN